MTIKDVEERTGLSRSNIRFYEKEKLIEPSRNESNGYRDYSENDVENIKKIAYLRTLGISIEDIRSIISEKVTLQEMLEKQKEVLKNQITDLNKAKLMCEKMLDEESISYEKLQVEQYVTDFHDYWKDNRTVFKRRKEYIRASSGKVKLEFKPQLDKSFSRGFTNYFLFDRNKDIFSFDTPKSLGEEMGTVKEIRGNYLTVAGIKSFNNGDGVCFLDETGKLQGFRINRVENNKLFPQEMPRIKPRTILYRNFDQEFERLMSRKSAERKIAVILKLAENNRGFTLSLTDEDDHSVSVVLEREKERARTPQEDNLRTQLGKLGNTPFEASDIVIDWSDNWFIPASMLAELRRKGIEKLLEVRRINYRQEIYKLPRTHHAFPVNELTYLGNVMNADAVSFYRNHGVQRIAPAYEKAPAEEAVLMFCKHCLRYSMGWCPSWHKVRSPYREPYYLVSSDNRRFRLEFDCKNCQMKVYAEK